MELTSRTGGESTRRGLQTQHFVYSSRHDGPEQRTRPGSSAMPARGEGGRTAGRRAGGGTGGCEGP